eukprot:CAMPEP_0181107192 /NCGR_PEP_ID=MMETSP1071-20121207/16947_1 /TAXON_ID=35127 /ORGANISM="Thalassiosira sp., Strain NH16" /LENGTH=46 /DNA_ID= /DNA_START= /DNA_END= /DNA_ORIENTATION=
MRMDFPMVGLMAAWQLVLRSAFQLAVQSRLAPWWSAWASLGSSGVE